MSTLIVHFYIVESKNKLNFVREAIFGQNYFINAIFVLNLDLMFIAFIKIDDFFANWIKSPFRVT